MTTNSQNAPAGSTPPSGRGLNAAERPPVRVTAAAPDGLQDPTAIRGTLERAGGAAPPAAPSAPPARSGSLPPGAGSGHSEPLPVAPARAQAVIPPFGSLSTAPRDAEREGSAGLGNPPPGPASTSPPAPKGAAGGARDGEAGVRTLRADLPPATDPEGAGQRQVNPAPSGTTPPPGKEGRDAWRKALSAQARDKRIARGKWSAKRAGSAYAPGMTRRLPPGSGGAA